MKPQAAFSPVSLRYAAALHGVKPKRAGTAFAYAEANCRDAEKLICLAASNSEGRFYGFVTNEEARRTAEELATRRGVFNSVFLTGTISEILARLGNGSALPPMLDYLCCDETGTPLPKAERAALFDLAQKRLNPGGLFATSYRAYEQEDGALRFIVRELVPEMNDAQKQTFLLEIKKLAATYLSRHQDVAQALTNAIVKGSTQDFFAPYMAGSAQSGTFETMVELGTRGMSFAGDMAIAANYVEMSVPAEAQDLVVSCRKNPLYEAIKDVALNRQIRSDIWVKSPADLSSNPAELFGGFTYGVTMPRAEVPVTFAAIGKSIDLASPLYSKLLDLMTLMPVGIGDFLSHESGKKEDPGKILEAVQILVACGVATPMRGLRDGMSNGTEWVSVAQPRLVGSFNRYLDKTDLTGQDVWFASSVVGCGITIPAREALVMQALNRAGLSNSVSALMPELRRIAQTPQAKNVMSEKEPTPEMAQAMVREIVGKSLPQWYAFALLEAA